jgi:hypothetical protein
MNPATKPSITPDNDTVLVVGDASRNLRTIEYPVLLQRLAADISPASGSSAGLLTPEDKDKLDQIPSGSDLTYFNDIARHEHFGVVAAQAPSRALLRMPFAAYLRTNRAKIVRVVARCDPVVLTAVTDTTEFPTNSLWEIESLATGATFNATNTEYIPQDDSGGTHVAPVVGDWIRIIAGTAPDFKATAVDVVGSGSTDLRLLEDSVNSENNPIRVTIQVYTDAGGGGELSDGGSKLITMGYAADMVDLSADPLWVRADPSSGRADEIEVIVNNRVFAAVVNPRVTLLLQHDFNALTAETS